MKSNLKQASNEAVQIITPRNTFHVDPGTAAATLKACEQSAPNGRVYAFEKDKVITLVNEPIGTPHEGCKVYIKE